MAIAAETVTIGEMFEDAHGGAAFRTGEGRILAGAGRFAGDELVATGLEVLAAMFLQTGGRVPTKLPG